MREYLLKKQVLVLFFSVLLSPNLFPQTFEEQSEIYLPGINSGSVAWGDYDNDGDLDILLTGGILNKTPISKIFRNDGNDTFTEQSDISLTGVDGSCVEWGDYDNDGDLDILLSGRFVDWSAVSKIYKNNLPDSLGFSEQNGIGLIGVRSGSVDWGDYDNDGDLDILLTGNKDPGAISRIYKNDGNNIFSEQNNIVLTGVQNSSVAWGDYNNDGNLDILLTGGDNNDKPVSLIYKNNGDNTFNVQSNIILTDVKKSSVAWGDYDNDEYLDILLTGESDEGTISKIYKNNEPDSSGFTEQTDIILNLTGDGTSSTWVDYDNDGDLDIHLTGNTIYNNNGDNTFTERTDISLVEGDLSSLAWGDYDNDGDLDILTCGRTDLYNYVSLIYKNINSSGNTIPVSPGNLSSEVAGNKAILVWNKATDAETPQTGLSYNIYVSTTPKGTDIYSPHADLSTGYRKVVDMGNIRNNSYTIKDLEAGTYYWSVQTIDNSFSGSNFADEESFTITFTNSIAPIDEQFFLPGESGIPITVSETEPADSRQWKYSIFPNGPYNNIIEGETALSYTPLFSEFAAYYVVCVSTKDGVSVTSNEIKLVLPQFTEQTGISLYNVDNSSVAWGDYDNDGDLDILLTGSYPTGYTKIYKNDGPPSYGFTALTDTILTDVGYGSVAWGDYNNDNYLDILLAGENGEWPDLNPVSKIFKNNQDGSFTGETNILLTPVSFGQVAWADFDQDGDLDCILAGRDQNNDASSKIYLNVMNEFVESDIKLKEGQSIAIADYNQDNYPDILIAGKDINDNTNTSLYLNNSSDYLAFSLQTGIDLIPTYNGSLASGDFDANGASDILLTGLNNIDYPVPSIIYKNNVYESPEFTEQTTITLSEVYESSIAWGDYDNDGDLDILLTGGGISKIYKNNGPDFLGFTEQNGITLPGIIRSSVAWGDYDNDGDLDIIFSGNDGNSPVSKIYSNNNFIKNTKPEKPANLRNEVMGNHVKLIWDDAIDIETPTESLSYNVCVGTSPDKSDIVSPMSLENGLRKIPAPGNAFLNNEYVLNDLDTGTYYWRVQAIDNGFLASEFSEEKSFTILPAFTAQTGISLTGVSHSSVAWGDYDNDGDLDILLTGITESDPVSKIYKNNGAAVFIEQTGISLTGVSDGKVVWGDYNNDGNIDILLGGDDENFKLVSIIYKNNGLPDAEFTEQTNISLDGSPRAWGDYDNDGDPDILQKDFGVEIFKNNGPSTDGFTEQSDIYFPANISDYNWGDYDNDGDLDVLLIDGEVFRIYVNNGENNFTEKTDISFPTYQVNIAQADYDNDGDLDILLSGKDHIKENVLNLYRNDGPESLEFTNIETDIRKLSYSSVAWGDYDNDGYSDLLITGRSGNTIAKVYHNNQDGSFSEQAGISLEGVWFCSVAWGDYDNDGDLDIILTGEDETNSPVSKIYTNNTNYSNHKPSSPKNLLSRVSGYDMKLTWDKAIDPDCPEGSLYYNLRIGSSPGAIDIMSPMANLTNGYRNIPAIGNAYCNTFAIIKDLIPGETYYWSVQAIDQSFTGGEWAEEQSFIVSVVRAEFTADTACFGVETNFTSLSLSSAEPISEWHWDFGDGNTSVEQNPVHVFANPGDYLVKLLVKSPDYSDSISKYVTVLKKPVADFSVDPVCHGQQSIFMNNSLTNDLLISSWHWDLGDGQASSLQNPGNHFFAQPGSYNTRLTVSAENGCFDTLTKVSQVGEYPIVLLSADGPTELCSGEIVTLSVEDKAVYAYQWNFNDLPLTNEKSASLIVTEAGLYSINVTNNLANCTSYSSNTRVSVIQNPAKPVIVYEGDASELCPSPEGFSLDLDQASQLYTYQWKRNGVPIDNASSSSYSGSLKSGIYTVTADLSGCSTQSDEVTLTFKEAFPKPDLYVKGPVVWYMAASNDTASHYKWYLNDKLVPDADKFIYVANQTLGTYKVAIANDLGCYTVSDEITIPTTKSMMTSFNIPAEFLIDEDLHPFANLKIYPNPTPGMFTVEMDNNIYGELDIRIFTNAGKQILNIKFEKTTEHFQSQIDLSGQGKGMYLINFLLEQYKANRKIVVE